MKFSDKTMHYTHTYNNTTNLKTHSMFIVLLYHDNIGTLFTPFIAHVTTPFFPRPTGYILQTDSHYLVSKQNRTPCKYTDLLYTHIITRLSTYMIPLL